MIWASVPVMITIDFVIVIAIAAIIGIALRHGDLRKGRIPRLSRALVLAGIVLIGLYYLADIALMTILTRVAEAGQVARLTDFLRVEARPVMTLAALLLIGTGLIQMAQHRRQIEEEISRSEKKIASVKREIVQSEIRFRSLIEQTTDAVYCVEFAPGIPVDAPLEEQVRMSYDGMIVECNSAFARDLGYATSTEALGSRITDLYSAQIREPHERLVREFVRNGYRLEDYDLEFVDKRGNERSLQVNLTGVVIANVLVRIWGAEIDTLEKKQVERALFDRRRFQEFVSAMSSRLIKSGDYELPEILQKCLTSSCEYFGYDRVSIVWFDVDQNRADAVFYWNEHGGPPGVEASIDNYPWLAQKIFAGELITIGNIGDLPDEAGADAASLRELGLGSMVAVPLAIGDDIVGALTYGDLEEGRTWNEQALADLRTIADVFASVVNRVLSRQSLDDALAALRDAKERLEAENIYLMEEISSSHGFDEIIGESPQLKRCLRQVGQVAATTTTVLIQGDTGTGKELIARAIHELSDRNDRPLVKVNCAALPANLIESELFGHEKGAFTGAVSAKRGRFDLADGGTLFLDEIGDFPLGLQGKLLRALQEGEFQRLGGTETISVDVRVIAATNRKLRTAVDSGEFRADLYYRINTFPIYLPRLRERIGDIPILAEHFTAKHAARLGKDVSAISAAFMEELNAYDWPGNIRELEGVIQQALISSTGPTLDAPESLLVEHGTDVAGAYSARPIADLGFAERQHIEQALSQSRWVIGGSSGAAAILGIPPSTLRSKMKKLGIERPGQRV